jgi:hypothetical protein
MGTEVTESQEVCLYLLRHMLKVQVHTCILNKHHTCCSSSSSLRELEVQALRQNCYEMSYMC